MTGGADGADGAPHTHAPRHRAGDGGGVVAAPAVAVAARCRPVAQSRSNYIFDENLRNAFKFPPV